MTNTSTPELDVLVSNHGSIVLVTPLTPAAKGWMDEHIPAEALWAANSLAVEPRYVPSIVAGMDGNGLLVDAA